MCHLILLMPLAGLPIFWLAPLSVAIPSYIVIVVLSGLLYWLLVKTMKQPIKDGFQSLVGTQAEVVSKPETGRSAKYLVRAQGELWSAYAIETFEVGEKVTIVAIKGIGLVVGK